MLAIGARKVFDEAFRSSGLFCACFVEINQFFWGITQTRIVLLEKIGELEKGADVT